MLAWGKKQILAFHAVEHLWVRLPSCLTYWLLSDLATWPWAWLAWRRARPAAAPAAGAAARGPRLAPARQLALGLHYKAEAIRSIKKASVSIHTRSLLHLHLHLSVEASADRSPARDSRKADNKRAATRRGARGLPLAALSDARRARSPDQVEYQPLAM